MTARVLFLDIETSPIVAHIWSLRDISVGINQIVEDPRMIGFGWKWDGERGVSFASEFDHSRQAMLEIAHSLLDEADVVVGYNSKGFDIPWINGELAREGFQPPAPHKNVDLYRIARKHFRYPSHKLQYVSTALGLPGKHDTGGHSLWVRCLAGDPAAWAKMERYCKRDVALLPRFLDRVLPWESSLNFALYGEPIIDPDTGKPVVQYLCPGLRCGSANVQKRGWAVKQTRRYQRYQCQDCGLWSTSTSADPDMKIGLTGETR